jgi:hypothetical protein
MKVNSKGQVWRTEDEWREIFGRWNESGVSIHEFCRVEGISHNTFRRWHDRLSATAGRSEFVPLLTTGTSVRLSWTVEVDLPNGAKLRFQG